MLAFRPDKPSDHWQHRRNNIYDREGATQPVMLGARVADFKLLSKRVEPLRPRNDETRESSLAFRGDDRFASPNGSLCRMHKFLMHGKPRDAAEMENQVVMLGYIDTSIDKANPQVGMSGEHVRGDEIESYSFDGLPLHQCFSKIAHNAYRTALVLPSGCCKTLSQLRASFRALCS